MLGYTDRNSKFVKHTCGTPIADPQNADTRKNTRRDGEFYVSNFQTGNTPLQYDIDEIKRIPSFSDGDLQIVLKSMSKGKCKDRAGIALEMIVNGCTLLQK